jgi:hypothetical protein
MNLKTLLVDKRFYSVLAIGYFSIALFPGNYVALDVGLDPSWRYAINYLPHSAEVFGRDVAFTYGPLGYFLEPLNIGSNLVQANLFHALMHGLVILILLDYALRRHRFLPTIFLVISFVLAPLVGEGLSQHYEYSYLVVSALLLVLSYENERFSLAANIINPLLAGMFLFMKFSLGLSAILMIATLAIVRIIRAQKNAWRSALIACGTFLVTTSVLAALYCRSPKNLVAWVGASWQMADGYSVAMSTVGKPHIVVWALIAAMVYLALLILLRVFKSPLCYLAMVFAVGIFLCFKHSYIRQDAAHVLYFFPFLLSLVGIVGLKAKASRELRIAVFCYLIVFILAIPNANSYHYLSWTRVGHQLWGTTGLNNIIALMNLNDMRRGLDAQGQSNLKADLLPAEWTKLIVDHDSTVGTFPWEVSYCAANNLRWDPLPALQAYNAHKVALDDWCANHYSGSQAPEFLLINFNDIDGRNLVLSTPATWRMILHNYALIKDDAGKDVQLFKRREPALPSKLNTIGHETVSLSEWISVPPSDKMLYAFLEMRLRPLGWTSKTFYHIPPVTVSVMYASGSYAGYRLIPDTARNGLLLNYLPTDIESLDRLFANTATDRVERFRISGPGASYYQRNFELTWKEEPNPAVVFTPQAQVSIKALGPMAEPALGAIEFLNLRPVSSVTPVLVDGTSEETITIYGWAVDPKSRREAAAVFVNIDGMDIATTYHRQRRDVAQLQHNPDYAASGFSASFPTTLIGPGKHELSLKIVSSGKDGYYQPAQKIILEVR